MTLNTILFGRIENRKHSADVSVHTAVPVLRSVGRSVRLRPVTQSAGSIAVFPLRIMFPTSPLRKRAAQKDKSRFTPQDEFTDLNPPITYRHLLSPNPGVRDPLRVIALCDSDAFYAACEQVRLGIDPSRPLVVRQWDALIAVNYPAREFGITRMSSWRDALKKCPELTVVHVATYKEGDDAPAYWDNPDTATHKVSYALAPLGCRSPTRWVGV